MAGQRGSLYSFNRGLISPLALARVDVKRAAIAAAIQQNLWPRVLGPMMLRPGLQRLGSSYSSSASIFIPFIKATDDTALLEVSSLGSLLPWVNDAPVVIAGVTTSDFVNPNFHLNIAGWTINDEAGATSAWAAGDFLVQSSTNGYASAIVDQGIAVAGANIGKEHSLFITVDRGPVTLRVGTATTDDSYINETALETGNHFLTFTPTGNFSVRFKTRTRYISRVKLCTLVNSAAAATIILTEPWGASDISLLRWEQSADVIFVACDGKQQRRIERRGVHSWSVVAYKVPDGPFLPQNRTTTTLTPTAIDGDVTITSSQPLFRSGHIGSLFKLKSQGQFVSVILTAADQWTDPIQVIGIGAARSFNVNVTNYPAHGAPWVRITLQQSYGVPGNWVDTTHAYQAAITNDPINDGLDNQIVFYRIGVKVGDFNSADVPTVSLTYSAGSITGVVRILTYTNSTQVTAQVTKALGGTGPVTTWSEGRWSDVRGWPSAVALHEGRLWWSGLNGVWGSVSDAFDSFDDTLVGDAGPISRSIGSGPVDSVQWMLSLQRLLLGTSGAEFSLRSSAFDEAVTPTNFNLRTIATQGSAKVKGVKIDQAGVFVSRTARRAYKLEFGFQFYEYTESDLTALCPNALAGVVIRIAVQRQPDTRIHFVMSDGTAVMCVMDPVEEVNAFVTTVTDGLIKDVAVLPAISGNADDQIYYLVQRTSGYSVEKFAQESEAQGGTLNKQADSFVIYQGAPATVITGLGHLEAKPVVVWADGQDVGTDDTTLPWTQRYFVTGGQITLAEAASNVVVGLGYTGDFQSAKLGAATATSSTPLNMEKRTSHLGLILLNTHTRGLRFGQDFSHLDDMPLIEQGRILSPSVPATYDENRIEFPGSWSTDMRVCLRAVAPRPATVLALTTDMWVNE